MASLAPTATLPPLGRLSSTPSHTLYPALQQLRSVYFPRQISTVRKFPLNTSTRKGDQTPFIDSGYASAEEDEDDAAGCISLAPSLHTKFPPNSEDSHDDEALEVLRADTFERAFAIKWLTGFIARADIWVADVEEGSVESTLRSDILEEATTILSSFTCDEDEDEADLDLARSFTFPISKSGDTDTTPVHVELNDAVSKEDHTSVGLQSWGCCILFAERLCLSKDTYLEDPRPQGERAAGPLRILELGAGTGMLSIVTAKLLSTMNPPPEIIATDYHPDVLANLTKNIDTNFPATTGGRQRAPVEVQVLDWESPTDDVPFDRPFDIILAADVIYHPDHAAWIKDCVSKLLKRPSGSDGGTGGVFWMFMAIRGSGRHEGLYKTVDAIFVDKESVEAGGAEGREPTLVVVEREDLQRRGGVGRADENGYKLSKIAWA